MYPASTAGLIGALSAAAGTSLLVAGLLQNRSRRPRARFTRVGDDQAVQRMHVRAAPRLGGLAIAAGLGCAVLFADQMAAALWYSLFLAGLPVFLAGLIEDSGIGLRPSLRLVAAAVSACLAVVVFGAFVPALDIPILDRLMEWPPLAIAFTVLCIAGVSHAFNLVDGLNGLAGAMAVAIAAALAVIANVEGQHDLALACACIGAATVGFLIFNYPLGRVFLGDAGAYGLGFLLIWLAVLLVSRVENVSAWALMLIFFWPVADTVLAIWRRLRKGRPVGQPDRLHYHQLVLRALEIGFLGRNRRHISNPLATALLVPLFSTPILAGVALYDRPGMAALASIGFAVAFFTSYALGVTFAASGFSVAAGSSRSVRQRAVSDPVRHRPLRADPGRPTALK